MIGLIKVDFIKYREKDIPIIEGGFGKGKRVLLVKSIAELYNLKVSEVNRIINKNLECFIFDEDIIDIKKDVEESEELRLLLQLSNREIGKRTKNIFILSEKGYVKLINKLSGKLSSKFTNDFIEDYFKQRGKLQSVINEKLSDNDINLIFKSAQNNMYIKEINRALITPKGKKGILFRKNEIDVFKAKVRIDMESYLLRTLSLKSLADIPKFAVSNCVELMENCYVLPLNLRSEFIDISSKLTEVRLDAIKERRLKNNRYFTEILNKIQLLKDAIVEVKLK